MAFLGEDDKLKQDAEQQGQQVGGGGQSFVSGQGSNDVGQATSSAGVTGGGGGNWTNIQAYMNANKDYSKSSDLLAKHVGGELEKEKSNIDTGSQQALDASNKAKGFDYSVDEANKDLNSASNMYNWNSKNSGLYGNAQQKISNRNNAPAVDQFGKNAADYQKKYQDYMAQSYNGPKEWSYGVGAQAQDYAKNLKDDNAFNNMMTGVYQKQSGSRLTPGQLALQNQLNVADGSKLSETRKDYQNKYGDLMNYASGKSASTTEALRNNEAHLRDTQNAIKDSMLKRLSGTESEISSIEDDQKQKLAQFRADAAKNPVQWVDPYSDEGKKRAYEEYKQKFVPQAGELERGRYNTLLSWLGQDAPLKSRSYNPEGNPVDPIRLDGEPMSEQEFYSTIKKPVVAPHYGDNKDGIGVGDISDTINTAINPPDPVSRAIGLPAQLNPVSQIRNFLGW